MNRSFVERLKSWATRERYGLLYPYWRTVEEDQEERRKDEAVRRRLFKVEQELERLAKAIESRVEGNAK